MVLYFKFPNFLKLFWVGNIIYKPFSALGTFQWYCTFHFETQTLFKVLENHFQVLDKGELKLFHSLFLDDNSNTDLI